MSSLRARGALAAAALLAVSALGLAACSGGGDDEASSSTTTTAVPTTAAPVTTVPGGSDQCPGFRGSTTSLTSTGPTAPAFLIDATAGAQGCLDVVTLTFRSAGDGTPPGYTVRYRDEQDEPFKDGEEEIDVPGTAHLVVGVAPAASVEGGGTTDPNAEVAGAADSDTDGDGIVDGSGDTDGDGIIDGPGVPVDSGDGGGGGGGAGGGGGTPTYTGNLSLEYGAHHHLVIVRELPDGKDFVGQDTVNWVIGLDSVRPFRVDRAENPPRVMILIG
jgi:hypothetical protein